MSNPCKRYFYTFNFLVTFILVLEEIDSMVMLHSERGDGAVACYAGVCIYKGIWLLLGSWVKVTVFSVEG